MRDYYLYLAQYLDLFFLIYFFCIYVIYTLITILGTIKVFQRSKELAAEDLNPIYRSDTLPHITFLVAAYNESACIINTIENILAVGYEYKEILVVNDGSTDNTLDLIKEKFNLFPIPHYYKEVLPSKPVRNFYQSQSHPILKVIDKENGEKFDALNAGLNACETDFFITFDADTCVDDNYFETLIRPLLSVPETIAFGADVYIKNGCLLHYKYIDTDSFPADYLPSMQAIEYIRAFLGRQGWDYLGGNFVMSGAFSMLLTKVVIQCGGFAPTFANDMEIILRLNRIMGETKISYKISYVPDPVAWTDGPETLKDLARQRKVWHRGLLECIWYNKSLFFNPKHGKFGLFVFPFLVLGEAFEPVIELLGFIYIIVGLFLNAVNVTNAILVLAIFWGFTLLLALTLLLVEEMSFGKYSIPKKMSLLIWFSFIENIGYRQLNLFWRIAGIIDFFKKFSIIRRDADKVEKSVQKAIEKGPIKW